MTGASIVIAVAFDRAVQIWVIKQLAAATTKRQIFDDPDASASVSSDAPTTSATRSSVRNTK